MLAEKIILGIETSCDDTSLCLLQGNPENIGAPVRILAHQSFAQTKLLARWGGVVPEISARSHVEKLPLLLQEILEISQCRLQDINLIGVTSLPGLLGPLLTGLTMAKTLGLLLECPIFPVNHLFAHLEAIHLTKAVSYPYLGLLVSGGHSIFFYVRSSTDFTVLGTTIDDAAGEAFDKGGKLLGLPYPAGRLIDEYAQKGNPQRFSFPVGLAHKKTADLSFSGLKTSLRVMVEQNPQLVKSSADFKAEKIDQEFYDLCASYQSAIIKALNLKLHQALNKVQSLYSQANLPIVVGGGVACNSGLRLELQKKFSSVHFVAPQFCTDNGAMVANYAFRNYAQAVPFPDCLSIDAQSKFLDKSLEKGR